MYKMWTSVKTLKFIELLKTLPALWDLSNPEYKSRDKKSEGLQRLANEFETNTHEIDKKIKSVRSQFRREHRKLLEIKRTNGVTPPASTFWFGYEPLLYLLRGKDFVENYDQDDDMENTMWSRDDDPGDNEEDPLMKDIDLHENKFFVHDNTEAPSPVVSAATPPSSSSSSNQNAAKRQRTSLMPTSFERTSSPTINTIAQSVDLSTRDEFTVYGEYVALKLRSLKSERAKSVAQHKISGVLFEAAIGKYDSQSSNWLSHQQRQLDIVSSNFTDSN